MTRVASRARSTPASGSNRIESSPCPSKLGKRRAPSSGASRSTGIALLFEDPLARRAPAVACPEEPGDAARDEELGSRLALQLAPELERAPGRARVPGVVAVREADQPRLAARRGAHVAGRVLLDDGDVPAARDEPQGERAAEDAAPTTTALRNRRSARRRRRRAATPRAHGCRCAGSARAATPRGRPARGRRATASAASSDASGRRRARSPRPRGTRPPARPRA